jgi:hypothetical protein
MSAHSHKQVKRLFKQLESLGFEIVARKTGFVIYPPKEIGGQPYYTHGTVKAIKPIVKQFKKIYGVDLTLNP